jgi:hypothetical protein
MPPKSILATRVPTKEALDLLTKKMMSGRGKVIRVVGGNHEGCSGWINLNKPKKPPKSYNVILVLDDGTVAEKQVREINIDFPTQKPSPTSYAEAVFQQHSDILLKLNQLCDDLAMCKIENEQPEVVAIITKKLDAAVKKHRARTGKKALYREVVFQKPKKK